jgi:hypothetical protein
MKSNTNNNENSSSHHFIQHIIDRTIGTLSSLSSTKIANAINPAITPDILPENFQIPKQSRRILDSNTMWSTSEQQDEEYAPNVYDEYKDKRRIRKTEPSSRKSSDTTISLPSTTNIQQDHNNNSPKITPNSVSSSPENKKIDDKLKDEKEISSGNKNSINNIKPAEKGLQESPSPFFHPSSSPAIANNSNLQKKENDNNNNDNNSYYTKVNRNNNNNKTVSSPQNQRSNEAIKESLPSPKTVKEQPPHKDLPVFSSNKNKSKDDEKKFQQSSSKNQEDEKKLLSSAIERIIMKPSEQSQTSEAAKFGKKERIPSAPDNNNKNDKSSSLTPINQLQPSSSFCLTNQSKDTISYEIKPTKPNIDIHKANLDPIVTINIGRIEVRAFVPPSKSPSVASTKLQPV